MFWRFLTPGAVTIETALEKDGLTVLELFKEELLLQGYF